MAKALFLSLPLSGHVNPSLPLVQELVARGEDILYFATDPFAARIQHAGARYIPYRNGFLANMTRLPERLEELSWLLTRTTAEVLDDHLSAFRAESPDYLIVDSVAPWGQWAAQLLRIPVVTSISTFAINRRVLAFAASHGVRPKSAALFFSKLRSIFKSLALARRLRRRHCVRGPGASGLVFGQSDLNIVYTSRLFQPCGDTFDDRYLFIGPSIARRSESAAFPWDQARHPVLVYASLGTLFNTDVAFYRNCFQAFAGRDLQVILSIGENVSREDLGPIPDNFIVHPYVPQLDVLRRVAAFLTHGGMNSVGESLYHGVPVVVVPQMSEQAIVGRRVEELGAGLYLAKEDATPQNLRVSIERVIADDTFRRQAAAVRDSFQAAGGVERAAAAIFSFTGR